MQTHTVSIVPSVTILNYCNFLVLYHQILPLMPDATDASLDLSNPAISHDEMETGDSGPAFAVASLFPNHYSALHGADSTIDSLSRWVSLPSSYTEKYCQAFSTWRPRLVKDLLKRLRNVALRNGVRASRSSKRAHRPTGRSISSLCIVDVPA